nr:MAG: hypothetical protein [Porcellio scaber clopovirus]
MEINEQVYKRLVKETGLIVEEDAAHYLSAVVECLIKIIFNGAITGSTTAEQRKKKILPSHINQYLLKNDELRALISK